MKLASRTSVSARIEFCSVLQCAGVVDPHRVASLSRVRVRVRVRVLPLCESIMWEGMRSL